MIEYIVERKSLFPDIVKEIKSSAHQLILYGAGLAARGVYQQLVNCGVAIDHVAVNGQYLVGDTFLFQHKVAAIEEILESFKNINVFITFCQNIRETFKRLKDSGKVNKIFIFDGLCFAHFTFTYDYIQQRQKEFLNIYLQLQDELSRKTFIGFINSRISGDPIYMEGLRVEPQYFPSDIIHFKQNEIFVDCGAFDGDTVREYLSITSGMNNSAKIVAIEPEKNNFGKLRETLCDHSQVVLINKGVWSNKDTLRFEDNEGMTSTLSQSGETSVEVDTVDNMLENANVTFIKMDIEGAELEALQGAEKTIIRNRPKLAICVYHKPDDLIMIPSYIKKIVPEYKFFLRAHHYSSTEVVLYAVAE